MMMVLPSMLGNGQKRGWAINAIRGRSHSHSPVDEISAVIGEVRAVEAIWDTRGLVDGNSTSSANCQFSRLRVSLYSGPDLHATDAQRSCQCQLLLQLHLKFEKHERRIHSQVDVHKRRHGTGVQAEVDDVLGVDAVLLHVEVPHGPRRGALAQQGAHGREQGQEAPRHHAPEEPTVPAARVHEAREEGDDGELGEAEAQDARAEGGEGPEAHVLLLGDAENLVVLAVAAVDGADGHGRGDVGAYLRQRDHGQ